MKNTRFRLGEKEHVVSAVRLGARLVLTLDGQTREYEVIHEGGTDFVLRHGTEQLQVSAARIGAALKVTTQGECARVEIVGRRASSAAVLSRDVVEAPMTGKVVLIAVQPGASVQRGEVLLVLEAMKMEHRLVAPCTGLVLSVSTQVGSIVDIGMVLVKLRSSEEST